MSGLPADLLPALAFALVVAVIVATDGVYWERQRRRDEQARRDERAARRGEEA